MEIPSKIELKELYTDNCWTLQKIADKYKVSKTQVFRWIKKYNIPSNDKKNINIPQKEILENLYLNEKKDTLEIANLYQVHRVTVGKWLKFYNIKTRKINDVKFVPSKSELEELYIKMNKTMKDIAFIYKVNRNLVGKWLSDYNIESSPREITKEELEYYYSQHLMTTSQIGKMYGVDRRTIGKWLNHYKILIRSNQRKFYHLKAIPFTKNQKDFIVGTLLGDGHLAGLGKYKNSKRLTMTHCEKQLNYLLWKKEIMGNFVNNISCFNDEKRNSITWRWASITHSEFNFYHKIFYNNTKKIIKNELAQYLTPFGMAIWIMDDGWKNGETNIRISSEGFSKQENETLKNIIKYNFDINCKVAEYSKNEKKYYYLSFNKRNSILLTKLIKNYFHPSMNYKLINLEIYDRSPTTTCETSEKSDKDIVWSS